MKVITTLIYTLTSEVAFQAISFLLSFILGVALIVLRPNKVAWFEYCRAFTYFSYSLLCLVLLICQVVVPPNDFVTLKPLNAIIQYCIIVYSFLTIVAFVFVYYRHLPVQVDDKKKQDQLKEFNAFFDAFGNDDGAAHGNEETHGVELVDRKITVLDVEAAKSNQSGMNLAGKIGGSQASDIGQGYNLANASQLSGSRVVSHNGSQLMSGQSGIESATSASDLTGKFDWNSFENLINKGIKAHILSAHQGKLILHSIALKDPIVVSVFRSSEKKFNVFLEMMDLQVWKILELQASKSSNGMKGKKGNFMSSQMMEVEEEEEEEE